MEPDGLCALTCAKVAERLEDFFIFEDEEVFQVAERLEDFFIFEDEEMTEMLRENGITNSRVFRRAALCGTPYYPIIWDSDDSLVYPPTLRKMLATLHVRVQDFVAPRGSNGVIRSGQSDTAGDAQ